jgi:hypothetical protein
LLSAEIHFGPVLSGLLNRGTTVRTRARGLHSCVRTGFSNSMQMEDIMKLLEQGDGTVFLGLSLPPETSLALTLDDTGTNGLTLELLVLTGTTSVSIDSIGARGGFNVFSQLEETNNSLTKVTISGSEPFILGSSTFNSNNGDGVVTDIGAAATSPTTVHSSLTLIDASAATGDLEISAGATNTSSAGQFDNGGILNFQRDDHVYRARDQGRFGQQFNRE